MTLLYIITFQDFDIFPHAFKQRFCNTKLITKYENSNVIGSGITHSIQKSTYWIRALGFHNDYARIQIHGHFWIMILKRADLCLSLVISSAELIDFMYYSFSTYLKYYTTVYIKQE